MLTAQLPVKQAKPLVHMRPVGGGRFVPTLGGPAKPLGAYWEIARTTYVGYVNAIYDINVFTPTTGYVNGVYDLNAYTLKVGYINASYDLNTYTEQVGYVNAAYDIQAFTPKTGYVNGAYDLNTFNETTGFVNAHYDLNAFIPKSGYLNAAYDLNVYRAGVGYVNAAYDLNAFTAKTGYLNAHYDLNTFTVKVGYVNAAYDLNVYQARVGYVNAAYDLNAYVNQIGFVSAAYDLNVYRAIKAYLNGAYDLLANEVFYGYAINLETNALTKYEGFEFNSLSPHFGAKRDGIYRFTGTDNDGARIDWSFKTGKLAFETTQTRVTDAYLTTDTDGDLTFTMTADSGATGYTAKETNTMKNRKLNLARGHKGKYWQFEVKNKASTSATGELNEVELIVEKTTRRV